MAYRVTASGLQLYGRHQCQSLPTYQGCDKRQGFGIADSRGAGFTGGHIDEGAAECYPVDLVIDGLNIIFFLGLEIMVAGRASPMAMTATRGILVAKVE